MLKFLKALITWHIRCVVVIIIIIILIGIYLELINIIDIHHDSLSESNLYTSYSKYKKKYPKILAKTVISDINGEESFGAAVRINFLEEFDLEDVYKKYKKEYDEAWWKVYHENRLKTPWLPEGFCGFFEYVFPKPNFTFDKFFWVIKCEKDGVDWRNEIKID